MFASPKRSALLSWLLLCCDILLIPAVTGVKPQIMTRLHDILVVPPDIDWYKTSAHSGRGGGGVDADSPASPGKPAPFARRQFTPIPPMEPTLIGDPEIKPATFHYAQCGDPSGVASAAARAAGLPTRAQGADRRRPHCCRRPNPSAARTPARLGSKARCCRGIEGNTHGQVQNISEAVESGSSTRGKSTVLVASVELNFRLL